MNERLAHLPDLMLKPLYSHWCFLNHDFARALALSVRSPLDVGTNRGLWALYRLGMYESVARAQVAPLDWRGAFAKVVSLAACGEGERARQAIAQFEACWGAGEHAAALADALAPFMPVDAWQLVERHGGANPALHAALLLRTGQGDAARAWLELQPARAYERHPELFLFLTNAVGGTPQAQLQRLNAFLRRRSVPAVALKDESRPPAPGNLVALHTPAPVTGPLVTVLMTTFRTGDRVVAAIESVLNQSYQNLELIVVDDASGDDTPERVAALAERDRRVRLIRLPHNVGTYAAKGIGLALARGEFVTCHDSDDWSHPEKIARQVAPLLANPRLVCTASDWVRMSDDGSFYARPVHPLMRLNPSSPMFRRERVLRHAGAWDCVRTGADSEFFARLKLVFGRRTVYRARAIKDTHLLLSALCHP